MYIQSILYHVVDLPEFRNGSQVASYLTKRMDSQIAGFQQACLGRAESFQIANPTAELFGSDERYDVVQQAARQNTRVMAIANEMTAVPIFFVMLHEFGHVYHKHAGDYSIEQEREADEFATGIIANGALPTSLGAVGLIALRTNIVEVGRERDLSCRMASLLMGSSATKGRVSELTKTPGVNKRFGTVINELAQVMAEQCGAE